MLLKNREKHIRNALWTMILFVSAQQLSHKVQLAISLIVLFTCSVQLLLFIPAWALLCGISFATEKLRACGQRKIIKGQKLMLSAAAITMGLIAYQPILIFVPIIMSMHKVVRSIDGIIMLANTVINVDLLLFAPNYAVMLVIGAVC